MAANREDLISAYIDEASIKQQTDFFLSQVKSVLDLINKVKSSKIDLSQAKGFIDVANASKQLKGNLDDLSRTTTNFNTAQAAQSKTYISQQQEINKTTDAIKKQTAALKELDGVTVIAPNVKNTPTTETNGITIQQPDKEIESLKELNNQYKTLQQNTKEAILNYGAESEQAKTAAQAEGFVKDKLDALNASYKELIAQKKQSNEIPFTTNLDASGHIIEPQQNTSGSVVSEQELENTKKQLEVQRELDAEFGKAVPIQKEVADTIYAASGAYDKYTGSLIQNLRVFTENENILKQNQDEQSQIEKSIKAAGIATDGQISKLANLRQEESSLSEANKNLAVVIRNQAKEQVTATGSLEQLRAQLALVQGAYDKLNESGRNSSFGVELKQTIDQINGKVTELEQSTGRFQRNVGNYTNSVNILKPALDAIAQKITEFTNAGQGNSEAVEKLKADYGVIEGLLSQQQKGFSSVTRELYANKQALQTLAAAGLEDTDVFKQLQAETANTQKHFNELQQSTKLLSSEAPALAALSKVAEGIGAAYGVAASAASLFSDGDEEVQKELTKLVAIITLLESLSKINAVLKEKDALLTVFQTNALKIYNGILGILGITKKANIAADTQLAASETGLAASTQANAAASAELAVAQTAVAETTTANVVAMEAQGAAAAEDAAAVGVLAGTMEADAAVTVEATAATEGFAAAFAATGIGAIIIAVGAALVYLISTLKSESEEFDKNIEKQKALAEVYETTNKVIKQQADIIKDSHKSDIDHANQQLKNAQASGANQEKQFAFLKNINRLTKQQADDVVTSLGASEQKQAKLSQQLEDLNIKIKNANAEIAAQTNNIANAGTFTITSGYKRLRDDAQKSLDLFTQQYQTISSQLSENQAALDAQKNANAENDQLTLEEKKFNADEQRKIVLAEAEIEVDLTKSKNERILSDERSTLAQRLAAIKSNADAEKKLLQAQTNDVLKDPSSTTNDKIIAQEKLASGIKNINEQLDRDVYNLNHEYYLHDLAAQHEYLELKTKQEEDFYSSVANNPDVSLTQRINAYKKFAEYQKELINANYQYELDTKVHTDEELKTLEANRDAQLLNLATQTHAALAKIYHDTLAKQTQDIENEQKQFAAFITGLYVSDVDRSQQYAADVTALNESLQKKKISVTQYEQQKNAIENQYETESLNAQIDKIQRLIDYKKSHGEDTKQNEIDLANLQIKLSNEVTDIQLSNLEKLHDAEKQLGEQIVSTIQSIVDGGYDKQKNAIQDQIDLLETQRNKEIEVADATITNAQQKAAAEIAINAKVDAQETQLKQKQKQIDIRKAEFDKSVQVVQIIANTAQTEASLAAKAAEARAQAALLAANPLTAAYAPVALAAAGIIGAQEAITAALAAAQIATVLATPIPTYAAGTTDHTGGPAWVGDAYKKELLKTPDNKFFVSPAKPTLVDLPKHTVVYPDADKYLQTVYSMTTPKVPVYDKSTTTETVRFEEMTRKLDKRLQSLERTVANKKENHYHVTPYGLLVQQKDLQNQIDYLNENFDF